MTITDNSIINSIISGSVFHDMDRFHEKYNFHDARPTPQQVAGRIQFLEEELAETKKAALDLNPTEVVDGLIDLIVVAAGTLDLLIGLENAASAWEKVMTANHQKVVGYNKKRPNSNGQDLIKPPGWKAPNLFLESGPLSALFDRFRDSDQVETFREALQPPGDVDDSPPDRESARVLLECLEILRKKSADYATQGSSVMPADYYPNGLTDFVYMIDVLKRNRQDSLLDAMRSTVIEPNNESLEDTLMDRINYLALMIEWIRKKTPGQDLTKNLFNQKEGL